MKREKKKAIPIRAAAKVTIGKKQRPENLAKDSFSLAGFSLAIGVSSFGEDLFAEATRSLSLIKPSLLSLRRGISLWISSLGENAATFNYDTTKSSVYFKVTIAAAGTYMIYSNSVGTDFKINGVYQGDSTAAVSGSYNDDDNNAHSQTQYKWDFYVEVSLTAGDVYLDIKIPSGDTSGAKFGIVLKA